MAERNLASIEDANHCSICTALATHSTTDAVQTANGWAQTAPRFGCPDHKVAATVTLIDGTVMPFTDYHVN